MKKFLRLSRAPFLTAVLTPYLLGLSLAYAKFHTIDWIVAIVTLIALAFVHLGSNLLNDYYDYKLGADLENYNRTPFSGGSPDIVMGAEKPQTFLKLGILSLFIALLAGLFLIWHVDRGIGPLFYLGLAGIFIGYAYTAPPFKFAYRGLGEVMILLAFGPLPVLGTYYALTKDLSLLPVLASLPLSLLITNIIWINEIPDMESDKKSGKLTLVARIGTYGAVVVYDLIAVFAFASLILLVATDILPVWALIGLLTLPLVVRAIMQLHKNIDNVEELVPAQALTILTHFLTGILITVGIFIGK